MSEVLKKAMISQPMKGLSREEILANREHAVKYLESQGYEVVDTVFTNLIEKNPPLHCLSKSIETMAKMDLVYFLIGWENARGCRIEHECCVEYGVNYEDEEILI